MADTRESNGEHSTCRDNHDGNCPKGYIDSGDHCPRNCPEEGTVVSKVSINIYAPISRERLVLDLRDAADRIEQGDDSGHWTYIEWEVDRMAKTHLPQGWEKIDESERVGYIHYAWIGASSVNLSINNRSEGFVTKWTVSHFPESEETEHFKKEFQTVEEAINFARNWMEKHPTPHPSEEAI